MWLSIAEASAPHAWVCLIWQEACMYCTWLWLYSCPDPSKTWQISSPSLLSSICDLCFTASRRVSMQSPRLLSGMHVHH